jgi:hypothetical protein
MPFIIYDHNSDHYREHLFADEKVLSKSNIY